MPTPTPTATPTPTTLVGLSVSQAFVASVTGVQYNAASVNSNGTVVEVPAAPRAVFAYDAATASYQFTVDDYPLAEAQQNGQVESATFGPGTITDDGATGVTAVVTATFGAGQTANRRLIRFKAAPTNPDLALAYATFASFEYITTFRTTTDAHDYRPFAYGIVTAPAAVPTTGSATYRGLVAGRAIDASGFAINGVLNYDLTGTVTLTVDYASRAVTGSIALNGRSIAAGGVSQGTAVSLGTIALTPSQGLATLSRFSGSATGGGFEGFLAGPTGEELGLSVQAVIADPRDPTRRQRIALSGAASRR